MSTPSYSSGSGNNGANASTHTTTTTTVVTTTHGEAPPPPPAPRPYTPPPSHHEPSFSILDFIFSVISGLMLLALTLFAAAVLFIVAAGPGIVQKTIQQKTGFALKYKQFSINPFTGTIDITNLDLQNPYEFAQGTETSMLKAPSMTMQADLGSLLDKNRHIHLKDLSLHFSDVNLLRNSAGQTNVGMFFQRLNSATPVTGEHAPASSNSGPSTQPVISIDHLHLQVDNVSINDLAYNPPQTMALPLNLDYERNNIADVMDIRQDLTTQIISASAFHLTPQAILYISNALMDSASGSAALTKSTLQTGVNVTQQTTQTAAQKISNAASQAAQSIKSFFSHGQTQH